MKHATTRLETFWMPDDYSNGNHNSLQYCQESALAAKFHLPAAEARTTKRRANFTIQIATHISI